LQALAVGKKIALELGGNAAVIIHEDADLKRAAVRCVSGGFGYAGQSCISVQRILVHEKVAAEFTALLLRETAQVKTGDPAQKDVTVGPVIDEGATIRIMAWIDEAKKEGAQVLMGGVRNKNMITPTILSDVKHTSKISSEEVFAPVVLIEKYKNFEDALTSVNSSRFGLQAGVFTSDTQLLHHALQTLEVGGVVANDIPTYRADIMPYGGVKESGLGREGIKYAMEEFSERRTLITWQG
jgi:acyl-CoA reductase-like NAD-dependent aldehyde dehydrogenase